MWRVHVHKVDLTLSSRKANFGATARTKIETPCIKRDSGDDRTKRHPTRSHVPQKGYTTSVNIPINSESALKNGKRKGRHQFLAIFNIRRSWPVVFIVQCQ